MYIKAKIIPIDGNNKEGKTIECMFNPREYTIKRRINWKSQSNDTNNSGDKVYLGGTPAEMTLELFFDTYGNRKSSSQVEDVRKYTEPLWELTKIQSNNQPIEANKSLKKDLPPRVLFQWGKTWHFTAIILDMEQQFTLFMPDGTPVRSVIKVSLEQSGDATHFYGENGGPKTYNLSEKVRQQAGKAGNNVDIRGLMAGRG